jgi:hypothetical protein
LICDDGSCFVCGKPDVDVSHRCCWRPDLRRYQES